MGPITLTIVTPLIGALLLALAPRARERDVRALGLGVSLATFASSLWLLSRFDVANPDLQLAESATWIPSIGARLAFAVDGVSLVLILLTTFLMPLILVASWRSVQDRFVGYTAAFLVLQAAVIGVFATTDLLLFYVLFEFTLIPMYLIIGIWGGAGRRAAAVKFFLYTLAGGLLMLVGILSLHAQTGTFDYVVIRDAVVSGGPRAQRCAADLAVRRLPRRVRRQGPRCSRSTRGCPTRTPRRRPAAACSSPACCSRWARSACCATRCRCSPMRPSRSPRGSSASASSACSTARSSRSCSPT